MKKHLLSIIFLSFTSILFGQVTNLEVSDITYDCAMVNVLVQGEDITNAGVFYSTTAGASIDNATVYDNGLNAFPFYIYNLDPNTTYYLKTFTINSSGVTNYGIETEFTTKTPPFPLVVTLDIRYYSSTSIGYGGDAHGIDITDKGVCYSTSPGVSIDEPNLKSSMGPEFGTFTGHLGDLQANTIYYLKAFATNSRGTSYGEEITFKTDAASNQISFNIQTTDDRNKFYEYTGNGSLESISIAEIQTANYNTSKITPRVGLIFFVRGMSSAIGEVDPDYTGWAKLRVNQVNSDGITFDYSYFYNGSWSSTESRFLNVLFTGGNEYFNIETGEYSYYNSIIPGSEIKLLDENKIRSVIPPLVNTWSVSEISSDFAVFNGHTWQTGVTKIFESGIYYSKTPNVSEINTIDKPIGGACSCSWSFSINNLEPSTTYYLKAYTTNSAGTNYGEELSFTTLPSPADPISPQVTTLPASTITSNSADINGITEGAGITISGIYYATTPGVSDIDVFAAGGPGEWSFPLNNLNPSTTYYYTAFATNNVGTSYGAELSFTTLDVTNTPDETFILANYTLNADALDYSGNEYNGIVNGAVSANGHCEDTEGGYQFFSNGEYLEMPSTFLQNLTSGSIEIFLKIDHLNTDHWFFSYGLDTPEGIALCIDETGAFCYWVEGLRRGSPGKISPESWYHLVLTWDGSLVKTYINGTQDMELEYYTGHPGVTNHNLIIGAHSDSDASYSFPGIIDQVTVYSGVLDQSDIDNSYRLFVDCLPSDPDPDLIFHISADQGFVDLAGGNAIDNIGNVSLEQTNWGGACISF